MSGYGIFAAYYDALMEMDYSALAEYYLSVFRHFGHEPKCLLDAACGTGSLTLEFAERGIDVIGVDGSPEMLSVAVNKAQKAQSEILFLCQPLTVLDLYGTVDSAVCSMDSVNHLESGRQVTAFFKRAALFLEDNGLFVFDANTIYKHACVLGNNAFVSETGKLYCVWQNAYDPDGHSVEITLDFFERDGDVYIRGGEDFSERAYSVPQLEQMLDAAGFDVCGVFDFMTLQPPRETSERVVIAARKNPQKSRKT